MTQEDKELLLKDLCARLIYGVKVNVKGGENCSNYDTTYTSDLIYLVGLREIKPYLRPMSSMTKEECDECMPLFDVLDDNCIPHEEWSYRAFDWLNAHHFDYRGLIEKGLALEAPDGMYN